MGRVFVDVNDNSVIVTKYGENLLDKISQRKSFAIASTNDSSDTVKTVEAVTRLGFTKVLSEKLEGISDASAKYLIGLYSKEDYNSEITWIEVAYLLYYVADINKVLDWNAIKPSKNVGVCVLKEEKNGESQLVQELAKYNSRHNMVNYISSMREGSRYIPLPLYCAYIDFIARDDIDFGLTEEDMFNFVSQEQLNKLF